MKKKRFFLKKSNFVLFSIYFNYYKVYSTVLQVNIDASMHFFRCCYSHNKIVLAPLTVICLPNGVRYIRSALRNHTGIAGILRVRAVPTHSGAALRGSEQAAHTESRDNNKP